MSQIKVFPDPSALARAAAERFVGLAADAVAARGRFSVGLSGGSTPRALFALLATAEIAGQVDWANMHFFWGERIVLALLPLSTEMYSPKKQGF